MARKFKRIEIADYRGVHEMSLDLGERGILATGTNGVGKSTVVNAVRTLAQGGDTGPDAVRNGADKAVLIAFSENETIRRAITAKTASVTITTKEGAKLNKQQERLDERVGKLLDPMAVLNAKKPADVKALVLETMPARATLADLRAFAPDLPDGLDVSGHALEARKRAEKWVYDLRTKANADAEAAEATAARADADAKAAAQGVPSGAPPLAEAVAARDAARKVVAALDAQAEAAARAATKTAATRQRVADLKAQAERLRAEAAEKAPSDETAARITAESAAATARSDEASKTFVAAGEALRVAQAAYDQARRDHAAALQVEAGTRERVAALTGLRGDADRLRANAASAEAQARDLEAALVDMGATAPAQADRDGAIFAAAQADAAVKAAEMVDAAAKARASADALRDAAKARRARADSLDAQVKALREEAPAALLGEHAIPGIDLSGDEVVLVGDEGPVRLSKCCGFERLSFAIDLAKRVNNDSRLILIDGLEQIAEDMLDEFIDHATADGWTLVASMVTSGPYYTVSLDAGPASRQIEARRKELRAATAAK